MNILAFKVKKNEINISSFDHFTDIFLSMHVELITRGVPIGGCGGVTPPIHQFCRQNLLLSANSREGGNEKGEERKEGKEKEKRKGKERKENEKKKNGKREKGKERKEKEKREKEKKKLEKKERKRKEKMREDRKGYVTGKL